MCNPSTHRALGRLCVLSALLLSVSGEKMFQSGPEMIRELRTALADLAGEGRTYLGRLAGEQTVRSVQKVRGRIVCGFLKKANTENMDLHMSEMCILYFLTTKGGWSTHFLHT